MKTSSHPDQLPARVAAQLGVIRRRRLWVGLARGGLLAAAVFLGAMLVAMLVDEAVGWFDPRARYLATGLALGVGVFAALRGCVRPLLHPLSQVGAAREADDACPRLEERWTTVTELSQSSDGPAVRGSEALIRQVGSEAVAVGEAIDPRRVVPAAVVGHAFRWLLASAAATALFFAVQFSQANVLWQRFWMPGRNVSLTQVKASPADTWVPKGEPLTLQAALEGRQLAHPPTVAVRSAQGAIRQAAMSASASSNSARTYQYGLDQVSDSFEYRVRAGDGQTPWHRIIAADRPRIVEVKLTVVPPAYSQLAKEESGTLPSAVRVLAGSELEVGFRPDAPVERLALDLGDGRSVALSAGTDGWYRFRDRPTNAFTLTASAWNRFQLENKVKPTCRVAVYDDLPPSVRLLEPSDDVSVAPGEKVNVVFEATDDFGVAKAEVALTTTTTAGETNAVTIPVDLGAEAGRKRVRKSIELDPAALGLKQGDQLAYVVRVTDTREAPAQAAGGPSQPRDRSSEAASGSASTPPPESSLAHSDQPPTPPSTTSDQPPNPRETAEPKPGSTSPSASRMAAGKPSSSRPSSGDTPPPNDMERRMLDAGQCSACNPRNIKVDEWAGRFDGEKRKKLEIAIEPVLREIDAHLAQSEDRAGVVRAFLSDASKDGATAGSALGTGREHLVGATKAIDGLRSRTVDTPYAFIGLQLQNIGSTQVTPAGREWDRVNLATPGATHLAALDRSTFHIARARAMLADLTRTYESVKREQQVADAMQRLSKMYQVFLEDTQPLLGGSPPPINSYDRKIAEVDDAFVEKLKAMLEEKKKIMAELAKILAEDPRLLRRYLAALQLQGTSYRDQMTLLAERQKVVETQIAEWNAAEAAGRPALLAKLEQYYAQQHRAVAEEATRFRENLETWLPLDVAPGQELVKGAQVQAERILALIAQSAGTGGSEAGTKALEELRTLKDRLPELGRLEVTNRARLDVYVDNRMAEVESLITAQSGRLRIVESLRAGDLPGAAAVAQYRLNTETSVLREKLEGVEGQVSSMSPEIAEKAATLLRTVGTEVMEPQTASGEQLAKRDAVAAAPPLASVVRGFAHAESTFDELMRLIVAKLDEAPAPTSPGGAPPSLESLLAQLQDEAKAPEGLGLSCRPINVAVMRDWMRPGSNPGSGMGRGQAQAARGQAQAGRDQARQLERRARESARQASDRAAAASAADARDAGPVTPRTEAWNKLASRLEKNLLQGRDNTPPEQYRDAITQYFKTLSETAEPNRPPAR